jgi:hypothetical protein
MYKRYKDIPIKSSKCVPFEQVSNWNCFEKNQERDVYKMKCANKNGYSVIRILQEDVLYDKYDWLVVLQKNIDKIINEKMVQNIYMCLKDEYKDFVNITFEV